jgi:S-adenosylmethionine decarboxylase
MLSGSIENETSTSYEPIGAHVVASVTGLRREVLNDITLLEHSLTSACTQAGATVLGVIKHKFEPTGVTVLVLLAESHASLHTYPDDRCAFFDAFTCGTSIRPVDILKEFCSSLDLVYHSIQEFERRGCC